MKVKCGDRIKQRLDELNMSQADLCKKTRISKATMSQYISGKYEPTQKRLEIISKALRVQPAWLMGFDVPKQKEDVPYEPLKNADWDKAEEIYGWPKGVTKVIRIYNALDTSSQEQLIKYGEFLLSQKEK